MADPPERNWTIRVRRCFFVLWKLCGRCANLWKCEVSLKAE